MASADDTDPVAQGPVAAAGGADDENAALVAELEAELGGKPAPKKPSAKPKDAPAKEIPDDEDAPDGDGEDAPAAEPDEDGEPDAAEDDVDDDDADPDDEDDDGGDADAELDAEVAKDPALKKRLEAVRRTEERQRQQLERDRADLDRQRTAWETESKQVRAAIARIEGLAARAKIDPAGVLEALGLSPEDMDYAANLCHARGKAAAGKPEYRASAERAIRERELADKASANERRIAELEESLKAKEAQAVADRQLDEYFDRVFRKATDATPVTARLIAKRPKAARAELTVTANQLAAKLGRLPKVAELLAAHEKREVRALKLRGIDPPAPGAGKPAAVPASKDKPNGKPAAAKPAKPAAAAAATDPDEVAIPSIADLVSELQAARRN